MYRVLVTCHRRACLCFHLRLFFVVDDLVLLDALNRAESSLRYSISPFSWPREPCVSARSLARSSFPHDKRTPRRRPAVDDVDIPCLPYTQTLLGHRASTEGNLRTTSRSSRRRASERACTVQSLQPAPAIDIPPLPPPG